MSNAKAKIESNGELRMLKRSLVAPSNTNPRKGFNEEKLKELAESIRVQGILQPLLVRPLPKYELQPPDLVMPLWRLVCNGKDVETWGDHGIGEKLAKARYEELAGKAEFELVAGERRWRAAGLAKLAEVPVIVREMSDAQVVEAQHIENLQREDLTALEEGESYRKLIDSKAYTAESLAAKLGKSRAHLFSRLKLVKLSEPVRKALLDGSIDSSIAGLIATVASPVAQEEAMKRALNRWSFRDVKRFITEECQKNLSGARWKWDDAELVKKVGPCTTCPKRSGNIEGHEGSPNVCTDVECFAAKHAAWGDRQLKGAEANGQRVMSWTEYGPQSHSDNFVNLAERCYWTTDDKDRTWLQVVGKLPEDVKPILAQTREGEVVELLTKEDALRLGKANGAKFASYHTQSRNERSAERQGNSKALLAKMRLDAEIDRRTAAAAVTKTEEKEWSEDLWRLVAKTVVQTAWADSVCDVGKRRNAPGTKRAEHAEELAEAVEKMTSAQCRGLLLEILVLKGLRATWDQRLKKAGQRALELLRVDAEKIAAVVKEEMAAKKSCRTGAKGPLLKLLPWKGGGFKANADGVFAKTKDYTVVFAKAKKARVKVTVRLAQRKDKTWVYGKDVDVEGTEVGCGAESHNPREKDKGAKTEDGALQEGLLECLSCLAEDKKQAKGSAPAAVQRRIRMAHEELGELIRARQEAARKEAE